MSEFGSDSCRSLTSTTRPMSAATSKCDCKRSRLQPVSKYCTNHEVVCCTECVFEEHRDCKVEKLESVVQSISKQDEEKMIKQLDILRTSRQDCMSKLTQEKKLMQSKISEVYKRAKHVIDTFENDDVQKGETKYVQYGDIIKSDITACVNAKDALKSVKSSENNSLRFIKYKQAQKLVNEIQGTRGDESLEYIALDDIAKFLRHVKLGCFLGEPCIVTSLRGKYFISIDQSGGYCPTAICELPDGRLTVVSDIIIQLDGDYKPLFHTDLSGEVNDVCYMENFKLAFCLKTRLYEATFQLVEVSSQASAESSTISVGFQKFQAHSLGYIGKRVAFADGQFFIQDRQSVSSCNTSGERDKTLFSLKTGEMVDFTAKRDGSRFYIAYEETNKAKKIAVINSDGKHVFTIDDHDLKDMSNFCIDDGGRLFVACRESKRILLFDENGHKRGLVLDLKKEGEPVYVALHKKYNRLLVLIKDSDKLLVYDM